MIETWQTFFRPIFIPPWESYKDIDEDGTDLYDKSSHIFAWIFGWILTIVGIVGGGFFAPYLVMQIQVPAIYQDEAVIAIAFVAGFLQQILTVLIFIIIRFVYFHTPGEDSRTVKIIVLSLGFMVSLAPPIFAIYYYNTHFAPSHGLTGTGIVGGTALKIAVTFGFPLIKGVVTGAIFRWFYKKIRGDTDNTAKPAN